ncbi:restriction endonuclease subunit M [Bacteroides heparinolyticus]|uniref:restriction endonuclease subunit M n=1 Tax=Prevotella heparinolytica TaxID=28113 RepID=UPI003F9F9647
MNRNIDISENELLHLSEELLSELLRDHTTGGNIFWATDNYEPLGPDYGYYKPITIDCITGERGTIIQPRVLKSRAEQIGRTKDKAEVFTPSWVCNAQNNLIDEAWFGRKDVFNHENNETKTWTSTTEPIVFPEGRTWKDYVRSTRMEITCGEAPYLVSRYDATTGDFIPIPQRIGMLDRKLRVVSENTDTSGEWLKMAQEAYKNIYAYEWQGDNLLLAREALLMTFIEYYTEKFGKQPEQRSMKYIAYIIAWNVFQMDGLRGVVPNSCKHNEVVIERNLFEEVECTVLCPGCQNETFKGHNGTHCLIRAWGCKDPQTGKNNRKIRFVDLIKHSI